MLYRFATDSGRSHETGEGGARPCPHAHLRCSLRWLRSSWRRSTATAPGRPC